MVRPAELGLELAIGADAALRAGAAPAATESPVRLPSSARRSPRRRGPGRKPSQASRARAAGMALRSWQRAQSAGRRAGWDDASRALLREAVARGRLSPSALDRLAAAPHWIQRALARVLKLGDLDAGPVPRGEVAARIAATVRAFEAGNPLLRQIAAMPCPCGSRDCAAAASW